MSSNPIEPIDRAGFVKRVFTLFLPFVVKAPAQDKPAAIPLLRDGQPLNSTWLDSLAERLNEMGKNG